MIFECLCENWFCDILLILWIYSYIVIEIIWLCWKLNIRNKEVKIICEWMKDKWMYFLGVIVIKKNFKNVVEGY